MKKSTIVTLLVAVSISSTSVPAHALSSQPTNPNNTSSVIGVPVEVQEEIEFAGYIVEQGVMTQEDIDKCRKERDKYENALAIYRKYPVCPDEPITQADLDRARVINTSAIALNWGLIALPIVGAIGAIVAAVDWARTSGIIELPEI